MKTFLHAPLDPGMNQISSGFKFSSAVFFGISGFRSGIPLCNPQRVYVGFSSTETPIVLESGSHSTFSIDSTSALKDTPMHNPDEVSWSLPDKNKDHINNLYVSNPHTGAAGHGIYIIAYE